MTEQLYDKNGVPVYPGDLIKTFHYTGSRKKKHYLYHTVVNKEGYLFMVPTSHLEPSLAKDGGVCLLRIGLTEDCEIISGMGPDLDWLPFDERPRKK